MDIILIYIILAVITITMFAVIEHQGHKIKELETRIERYVNSQRMQFCALRSYNEGMSKSFGELFSSVTEVLDKYHGEVQQNTNEIKDVRNDISTLVKSVDKLRYKLKVMSTYDLPTPVSSDSVSYAWGYPDKEDKSSIVTGGLYLVIGYVYKTDETVKSYNAEWDGRRFVITDDGPDHAQYFDKVYAYIRMPDPSDIMTEVIKAMEKEKTQ